MMIFKKAETPKVCMVVSGLLLCSGTSQISMTQLKYCPVNWTGVAVMWDNLDESLVHKAAAIAPVYCPGKFIDSLPIHGCKDIEETLRKASAGADFMFSCSFHQDYGDSLPPLVVTCQASLLPPEVEDDIVSGRHGISHFTAGCETSKKTLLELGVRDVEVIRNAADPDRLTTCLGRRTQRRKWKLYSNDIAIGVVGRHHWEKNPTAVIRALPLLEPKFKAIYFGDQTFSNTQSHDLINMAAWFAPGRVGFYPPVGDMGDLYAGLDVMVLASHREGLSIAMLEAMSVGLPLVVTRVGAVQEIEDEFGKFAVVIPVDPSSKDVADGIRRALSDDNQHVVENARRIATGPLSAYECGRQWGRYFEGLLRKKASKSFS